MIQDSFRGLNTTYTRKKSPRRFVTRRENFQKQVLAINKDFRLVFSKVIKLMCLAGTFSDLVGVTEMAKKSV